MLAKIKYLMSYLICFFLYVSPSLEGACGPYCCDPVFSSPSHITFYVGEINIFEPTVRLADTNPCNFGPSPSIYVTETYTPLPKGFSFGKVKKTFLISGIFDEESIGTYQIELEARSLLRGKQGHSDTRISKQRLTITIKNRDDN